MQAQDRIVKTNKDTLLVKIMGLQGDKIQFRPFGQKSGRILEIYKNEVATVIYEDGTSFTVIYDRFRVSPDLYIQEQNNAFKVDLFALLVNHFTIGYERRLKPNFNLEVKAGIISPIVSKVLGPADGFLVKAGVKYVWTEEVIRKGLKYHHSLKGNYIRPELMFSYFDKPEENGVSTYQNYAVNFVLGKQTLIGESIVIDFYAGVGYGMQTSTFEASSIYDRKDVDFNYAYSHLYFGEKLPVVVSGGVMMGFIF